MTLAATASNNVVELYNFSAFGQHNKGKVLKAVQKAHQEYSLLRVNTEANNMLIDAYQKAKKETGRTHPFMQTVIAAAGALMIKRISSQTATSKAVIAGTAVALITMINPVVDDTAREKKVFKNAERNLGWKLRSLATRSPGA